MTTTPPSPDASPGTMRTDEEYGALHLSAALWAGGRRATIQRVCAARKDASRPCCGRWAGQAMSSCGAPGAGLRVSRVNCSVPMISLRSGSDRRARRPGSGRGRATSLLWAQIPHTSPRATVRRRRSWSRTRPAPRGPSCPRSEGPRQAGYTGFRVRGRVQGRRLPGLPGFGIQVRQPGGLDGEEHDLVGAPVVRVTRELARRVVANDDVGYPGDPRHSWPARTPPPICGSRRSCPRQNGPGRRPQAPEAPQEVVVIRAVART